MKRNVKNKRSQEVRDMRTLTLIEQKRHIRRGVLKGIELGVGYRTIANSCGVHSTTLGEWFKRCYQVEKELEALGLSKEDVERLSTLNGDLIKNRKELIEEYGEGVITLVGKEQFWLNLSYELKKAESGAETRMLGVIREAAIGHHEVVEEKRKSVMIEDPAGGEQQVGAVEVTTVTKQLRPQWQAAAWFLERKYPEKYAQKKIIEGELPKDVPYEVFMTAKLLLKLPKTELDKITGALRGRMRAQITDTQQVVEIEPVKTQDDNKNRKRRRA
jgi:hypothetical protein